MLATTPSSFETAAPVSVIVVFSSAKVDEGSEWFAMAVKR
jgi:hypothetical protein